MNDAFIPIPRRSAHVKMTALIIIMVLLVLLIISDAAADDAGEK